MKTLHEAYKLAEEIDNKISKHISPLFVKGLNRKDCINILLYIRTIQTTLDLIKTTVDSRLDKFKLKNELSKQKT